MIQLQEAEPYGAPGRAEPAIARLNYRHRHCTDTVGPTASELIAIAMKLPAPPMIAFSPSEPRVFASEDLRSRQDKSSVV